MHLKFFFSTLLICISVSAYTQGSEIDSLFVVLNRTMEQRATFDVKREQRIEGLKRLKDQPNISSEELIEINNQIINQYEAYSFDSTIYYIQQNLQISEALSQPGLAVESFLQFVLLLSSSGRFKEAIDMIDELDKDNIPAVLLADYYYLYVRAFNDFNFYSYPQPFNSNYENIRDAYLDSLLIYQTKGSIKYLESLEIKYLNARELSRCLPINDRRLAITELGTRDFSLAAFHRSIVHELQHERELEKKYLLLSAISDIQGSIKDNASLTKLALLLYEENEIEKAYTYIKFAFEDATFFNSRLRYIEIGKILPLISDAYQLKSAEQKETLRIFLITVSILSGILLILLFFIFRQLMLISTAKKELKRTNEQLKALNNDLTAKNESLDRLNLELSESNHIKEQYIGIFFTICSNFIDKLDDYRKMVKNMVVDRKYQKLYEITKSADLIDEEVNEFYKIFDRTFLNIYPSFVDQFNSLLTEESQISPKKGEILNTELRIFALIKLGITESSDIAKLLRYSVNTIYNYRVKIKNSSMVERDEFEKKLLEL